VDCSETISSALLFDQIVNKLRGLRDLPRLKMVADINNFVVEVRCALEELDGKVILVFPPQCFNIDRDRFWRRRNILFNFSQTLYSPSLHVFRLSFQ
jgi:hypothetical protein